MGQAMPLGQAGMPGTTEPQDVLAEPESSILRWGYVLSTMAYTERGQPQAGPSPLAQASQQPAGSLLVSSSAMALIPAPEACSYCLL